jgi:hypothetical protein
MRTKLLLTAPFLILLASCAAQQGPHEPTTLQHVWYHRTGGMAAVDDRVEIQPDGHVGVVKRGLPPHEAQLTRDQVTVLRDAFRGWSSLRPDYPAPRGAADQYQYEVKYGGKTVTGTDASPDLPNSLRNVWFNIEAISQQ